MADSQINYEKAVEYWSNVTPDYDGVLGGFGNSVIPRVDIIGSKSFLKRLATLSPTTFPAQKSEHTAALDVGAGVGRVTKDLLCNYVDSVDLVEPALPLIKQAEIDLKETPQARNYYPVGLQDFEFMSKYNLIWCQWCLSQVPDDVLVSFLEYAAQNLEAGGVICVKENQSSDVDDIFDEVDSSVTRTDEKYRQIFARANLRILLTALNKGMPKELFPVRMYALVPEVRNATPL